MLRAAVVLASLLSFPVTASSTQRLDVAGTLRDCGRPVANEPVLLHGAASVRTRTDANGKWAFRSIPGGTYLVEAGAPIRVSRVVSIDGTAIDLDTAPLTSPDEVLLDGVVLDEHDLPVRDALVFRGDPSGPRSTAGLGHARTNARGAFCVGPLSRGPVSLGVAGVGLVETYRTVEATDVRQGPFVFRLRRLSAIHGRVVDERGRPVADASVTVGDDPSLEPAARRENEFEATSLEPDGPEYLRHTTTDAGGRFALTIPALRTEVRVRSPDETVEVRIPLASTLGTVVLPRLAHVRVELGSARLESAWLAARSDRGDHTYAKRGAGVATAEIAEVLPGDYLLRVVARCGERRCFAEQRVSAKSGASIVVHARPSNAATVSGRLADRQGRPLRRTLYFGPRWPTSADGWSVEIAPVESGSDGAFAFVDVPPGEWTVATADGRRLSDLTVGSEDLRGLVLTAPGDVRISGRLVDEHAKALETGGISVAGDRAPRKVEADGRFALTLIEGSHARLAASAPGFASRDFEVVAPTGDVNLGDVLLTPPRTVRLRLSEVDGSPAVGVPVTYGDVRLAGGNGPGGLGPCDGVFDPRDHHLARSHSNVNGVATVVVPQTPVVLHVGGNASFPRRTVSLEATATDLALVLDRGGTLAGTLVDAQGVPVRAPVVAVGRDGLPHELEPTSGPFRLQGLAPGAYRVWARGLPNVPVRRVIVGATGEATTSLVEPTRGTDVQFDLRTRAGQSWPASALLLPAGSSNEAFIDELVVPPDGTILPRDRALRFGRVPPGRWVLRAWRRRAGGWDVVDLPVTVGERTPQVQRLVVDGSLRFEAGDGLIVPGQLCPSF